MLRRVGRGGWVRWALLCGLAWALSQAPADRAQEAADGYAQALLSGPLESISKTRIVVQGQASALSADSLLKGLDGKGRVVDLLPSAFPPGTQVSLFLEQDKGVARAAEVYRGQAFLLRGTVSALKLAKDGYVETLTVDGHFVVAVTDADFTEGEAGAGDGGSPEGGQDQGGDPSVEVGDEIMLKGIASSGAFTAVQGRVIYVDDGGDDSWDSEAVEAALKRGPQRVARAKGLLHGRRRCSGDPGHSSVSNRDPRTSRPAGEMSENCTATSTPSPGTRRSRTTCP